MLQTSNYTTPNLKIKTSDFTLTLFLIFGAFFTPTYLNLPLYGQISLYFGSLFTFIALLTLPKRLSIFVLISNVIAMHFQIASSLMALILVAEYLTVMYLIKRHVNPLISVSLFWSLFGFPAILAIFYLLAGDPLTNALFTSLTVALNGFVCGVFALMIYRLIPLNNHFKRTKSPPRKYAAVVLELCIIVVLMPTILVALFFTWYSTSDTESKVGNELDIYALQLQNNISQRLNHNLNTVLSVAETIDSLDNIQAYSDILNAVVNSNQDFESMLIAEVDGSVKLAGPTIYNDFIKENKINLTKRKYFKNTIERRQPVVSEIVKSFGDNSRAIIATTAPIIVDDKIIGVTQGAIWLKDLIDIETLSSIEENDVQIIISDQNGSVIYASEALNLDDGERFSANASFHPFVRLSPVTNINNIPYMFEVKSNKHNWQVYTLASPRKVIQGILDYFFASILILLLSFCLVIVFSRRLSASITKPLVNLESFVAGKISEEALIYESKVSQEMVNVSQNLIESYQLSQAFNQRLKEQVAEQTAKLTNLNDQLYLNSRIDSLTNLLNRGAFDQDAQVLKQKCVAEDTSYAIAIIDIDHFKKINDQHGHTAGDRCIKHVANRLTQVFDNSNLIARYGGEEYVVMITNASLEECVSSCELLRSLIQNDSIIYEQETIMFTISVGLAFYKQNKEIEYEKSITNADDMLYKSKTSGRNQVSTIKL
ncbi:diguanylate cyclase [Glaciecola sp. KUL10]|nr:diguanylate cyclase [Glaciecola sp. KUL10]